jgi:sulfopyruvate decarboxylase subunit beta
MTMKRTELIKILAKYRTDELVITSYQSIKLWQQYSPSKYNFQSVRTMGECSTFALGLALARPDKRVISLEGDGCLCMNLGSLLTIANAAPPNFYQFIMHNRIYESSGGQTIPCADVIDLAMIARGCGIRNIHHYGDVTTLEKELPEVIKEKGPVFVINDIVHDESHMTNKEFAQLKAQDRIFNKEFREALRE